MIDFTCPHCKRTLKIPEEYLGHKGRCNYCQGEFTVSLASPITAEHGGTWKKRIADLLHVAVAGIRRLIAGLANAQETWPIDSGTAPDISELRTAAEQGDAHAQSKLCVMYANGGCAPKAATEAAKRHGKAAAEAVKWCRKAITKPAKSYRKAALIALAAIVIGILAVTAWPTLYRYDHLKSSPVRINVY